MTVLTEQECQRRYLRWLTVGRIWWQRLLFDSSPSPRWYLVCYDPSGEVS